MSAWTTTYYVYGHHRDEQESLQAAAEMVLTRFDGGCTLTVPIGEGPPLVMLLRGTDADLVVAIHDLLFYQGVRIERAPESG